MEIKSIKKEGYNLHLLKNKNFKTILTKVIFWEPFNEEEITIRNMLMNNLLFSSKNYKTHKEITIKEEDLYGAALGGGNYRKGNYIFSEFYLSTIEEKYTEKNLLDKSYEFLFDIIQNPNVDKNKFNSENFNINYEFSKTQINSEKEKPGYYALTRYKKLLGESKPFAFPIEGNITELEKITEENLYEFYQKFAKNSNIDIFVTGNINFDKIEKIIDKYFKLKENRKTLENISVSYEKPFTETKIKSNFAQSRLVMGGKTSHLSDHEKKYESIIFNIIFGSSPNSKLFKNVREKHSYAYSITSSFVRLDEMFYITAGISKENYEDTKKQITHELEEMKQGHFTLKDIKNAKEVILGLIEEIDDYQGAIIDHYFNYLYLESDTLKNQKEEIKKITKEDIIKFAKKINIDTIFLVEEDENGNN